MGPYALQALNIIVIDYAVSNLNSLFRRALLSSRLTDTPHQIWHAHYQLIRLFRCKGSVSD